MEIKMDLKEGIYCHEKNHLYKAGILQTDIIIEYADMNHLESWMKLIDMVRWTFPGLETQKLMEGYRNTVIKNIKRKSAVCALNDQQVVGTLLFSVRHNMISFLAVHPEYRRKQIGTKLFKEALKILDRKRDIGVDTFGENDPSGVAARGFYKKLGFEEDKVILWKGGDVLLEHPQQRFILRAKKFVKHD